MYHHIKSYSYTVTGYWLRLFNWERIKILKLPFSLQGLVTAFYLAPFNVIFIAPDKDGRVFFGTLIHELYHAHQKSSFGILKYFFLKCFFRYKLQEPAKKVQLQAVQWACSQDRKEFEQWES